jgi:hypothetical protein
MFVPVVIGGIALIALGAYAFVETSSYTPSLKSQLDNVTQTLTTRTKLATAETKELEKEISDLEKNLTAQDETDVINAFHHVLDPLEPGRAEIIGDLGEMNKLPGPLDLLSVTHNNETMKVNGIADDENVIFSYAGNLRKSGRFSMVIISSINYNEDSARTSFSLTLTKSEE